MKEYATYIRVSTQKQVKDLVNPLIIRIFADVYDA